MHELPFFILIKYLAYVVIFYASFFLLRVEGGNAIGFSLKWAGYKILIGLVFGLFIGAAYTLAVEQQMGAIPAYLLSFGLIRVLEWATVLWLVSTYGNVKDRSRVLLCAALGISASLLSDLFWNVWGFETPKFVC
jgi:hypothetical protein